MREPLPEQDLGKALAGVFYLPMHAVHKESVHVVVVRTFEGT